MDHMPSTLKVRLHPLRKYVQEQRMSSRPSTRSREKILGRASTFRDIADALKTCRAIEGMTVHGIKKCGTAGADALTEALAHHTSLVRLKLNLREGADTGVHGVTAVAKALLINTTLMCLNFGLIFGDVEHIHACAVAIAEALISNTTLTDLTMEGYWHVGNIGPEGATALAEGLKVNPSLRSLHLGKVALGEAGGAALGEALQYNTSLTELDVHCCRVGDQGTIRMANALKINTSLTFLNLMECRIGAEGAIAMAEALRTNTTITRLDLHENRGIPSRGVTALAKALEINTTLQHLDLRYTSTTLDSDGAQALGGALDVNSSLTRLGLPMSCYSVQGAHVIGTAWGNNCALSESLKIEKVPWAYDPESGRSDLPPEFLSAMHNAKVHVVRRRELLLAFGMAMLPRLGGVGKMGDNDEQASAGCPFFGMQPDIFKMVRDAY
jgi:hypothetical protein